MGFLGRILKIQGPAKLSVQKFCSMLPWPNVNLENKKAVAWILKMLRYIKEGILIALWKKSTKEDFKDVKEWPFKANVAHGLDSNHVY